MVSHIGHKKLIDALKRQIVHSNIHHAYIFIGPENIGKLNLAKHFAILIHNGKFDERIKNQIEKGNHPDTIIISPKSAKKTAKKSISIDQIHQLLKKCSLSPHSSKKKVGIIVDAQLMTPEAGNSFLKTLEEPTKTSIFILLTTNEKAIIPTVVSRCQKIYLNPIGKKEILRNLINNGVDKVTAELISNLSAGKPGIAIRLTDKSKLKKYNDDIELLEKIFESPEIEKLDLAKTVSERRDIIKLLNIWQAYLRDILVFKENILDILINVNRINKIKELAKEISFKKIQQMIEVVKESQIMLAGNANPKLVLENLFLEINS